MSIRLGIIGAGTIGQVHAEAAHATGQEVVAIADVNLSAAEKLAAEYEGVKSCRDAQELFGDDSIDTVVVGVPNCLHKDLAIAAMKAGKDVLLEKPMGLNAAECAEINKMVVATGRLLQIGMFHRFSAAAEAAKRVIDSGDLGTIYHAKAHLYRRRGVPGLGGWFTTKDKSGGGPLIDIGVHIIDLVLWLMNFPQIQRVSGKVYSLFGRRMKDYVYEGMWAGPPKLDGVCDVEDSAHAMIYFDGGGTLDLQVSWAINKPGVGPKEESLIGLYGDQGGLSFKLRGDHVNLATEQHGRDTDIRIMLPEVQPYHRQTLEFVRCVETRELPLSTGQQGEQVQSVIDAIYQSSESNREITIG